MTAKFTSRSVLRRVAAQKGKPAPEFEAKVPRFPSKNKLHEIEIRNPFELAMLGPRIFVSFSPQQLGRVTRAAHYSVVHIGNKTDPGAHWMDYGNKTFNVFGHETKPEVAAAAVQWATGYCGITEWVRDPFGGFQDAKLVEIVKQKLKEKR